MYLKNLMTVGLGLLAGTLLASTGMDNFEKVVRPVLDKRCVVCHGCYTSPCNLKLDSYFGVLRGASKDNIYDGRYFGNAAMKPNRIFQDAVHHHVWQKNHAYHTVLKTDGNRHDNLKDSIMYQMLDFRRSPDNGKKFEFDAVGSRSCVADGKELARYKQRNSPLAGMPYGMETLSDLEFSILKEWLASGAPGPSYHDIPLLESISLSVLPTVQKWEALLNGSSNKEKLVARYLWEHFYAANIHFDKSREFYRLVRSKTPPPLKIEEIATRRPYDSAGDIVFYRFKKVVESVVHKNHIPLDLSEKRLELIGRLFFTDNWKEPAKLPSYSAEVAANPFIAFKDIPAKIRYKFFLEHSYYFIRSFIHGPVCNGQVATNVIRDHFWVFFLDPEKDPAVTNEKFLIEQGENLDLPAKTANVPNYRMYQRKNRKYQKAHAALFQTAFKQGLSVEDLWDGDKTNPNAVLTVYRHFLSASVYHGAKGSVPKTVWILDYPIFERIYYDLVAAFDVWGSAWHKMATRRYMDLLRTESEDLFLTLIKPEARADLRRSWNTSLGGVKSTFHPFFYQQLPSKYGKETVYSMAKKILQTFTPEVSGGEDRLNDGFFSEGPEMSTSVDAHTVNQLSRLTSYKKEFSRYFPEITLLKVNYAGNIRPAAFTILANKDRPYVNYMFIEPKNPEADVLNILPTLDVSYANYFLEVNVEDLENFVNHLLQVKSEKAWNLFRSRYGKSRLDRGFWNLSDWFQDRALEMHAVNGGIIDLSRYAY